MNWVGSMQQRLQQRSITSGARVRALRPVLLAGSPADSARPTRRSQTFVDGAVHSNFFGSLLPTTTTTSTPRAGFDAAALRVSDSLSEPKANVENVRTTSSSSSGKPPPLESTRPHAARPDRHSGSVVIEQLTQGQCGRVPPTGPAGTLRQATTGTAGSGGPARRPSGPGRSAAGTSAAGTFIEAASVFNLRHSTATNSSTSRSIKEVPLAAQASAGGLGVDLAQMLSSTRPVPRNAASGALPEPPLAFMSATPASPSSRHDAVPVIIAVRSEDSQLGRIQPGRMPVEPPIERSSRCRRHLPGAPATTTAPLHMMVYAGKKRRRG